MKQELNIHWEVEGHRTHPWGVPPTLEALNFLEHSFVEHGALQGQNTHVQGRVTVFYVDSYGGEMP